MRVTKAVLAGFQKTTPRYRARSAGAVIAAVALLSGCVGGGDPVDEEMSESGGDLQVEDAAPSVSPSTPSDSEEPESGEARQAPPSCDFESLRDIGWTVLEANENLDPTRFYFLLSRPDPVGDVPEGLRCVYGGDSYHDILVIEFQPIADSAAIDHQALLSSQSYSEAAMSTSDTPVFFRALVTLDGDVQRLPGDIAGFDQEVCWDLANSCLSEVVIYGPGSWAVLGWAGQAWSGGEESSLLTTVRDILLEGW
jgi:hypothetical protein